MNLLQILNLLGLLLTSDLFSEAEGKKCSKVKERPEQIGPYDESRLGSIQDLQARVRPFEAQGRSRPYGVQGRIAPEEVQGRAGTYDPETRQFVDQDLSHITYFLYPNYNNNKVSVKINMNDPSSLDRSGFDPKYPVKILVHGFTQNFATSFPVNVRDAYLKAASLRTGAQKVNTIVVDWGPLAEGLYLPSPVLYPAVADNVQIVGKDVARFINFLKTSYDLIHIVGFSLGAHVSGVAGAEIHRTSGKKLGRVTGLDPAGPSFGDGVVLAEKLDKGDAKFVDVLHTDADVLGTPEQSGSVDFYANGGEDQPNCGNGGIWTWAYWSSLMGARICQSGFGIPDSLVTFNRNDFVGTVFLAGCDHNRAPQYFALSVDSNSKFKACPCETSKGNACKLSDPSCKGSVPFGEHCPPSARGKLYLAIKI